MKKRNITKLKGDIGLTQIIADLTKKGYEISLPIAEHMPYDLICHDIENDKLLRIQAKYSSNNKIICYTSSYSSKIKKSINTKYDTDVFEYYALYLPSIEECIYIPNIGDKGIISVRCTIPNCYNKELIWWEDYKLPNQTEIIYRKPTDIDPNFKVNRRHDSPKYSIRKVKNRPSKEELEAMIETTPMTTIGKNYGVSDNAVRKWAKSYKIEL